MKCYHCNEEMIWGGDHDIEDETDQVIGMETNLSCSQCDTKVTVYLPKDMIKEALGLTTGVLL